MNIYEELGQALGAYEDATQRLIEAHVDRQREFADEVLGIVAELKRAAERHTAGTEDAIQALVRSDIGLLPGRPSQPTSESVRYLGGAAELGD